MNEDKLATRPEVETEGAAVDPRWLTEYLNRQQEWSSRTFGYGARTLGVTKHIEKELAEIRANPYDLSEWVDVMILAMDGYWRHGGSAASLEGALQAKQDKNVTREWPAPTSQDDPVEHVRSVADRPHNAPLSERDASPEKKEQDV